MHNFFYFLQQSTSVLTSKDIREWIQFIVLIIGGFIAYQTYSGNQRQRRLENSLRLIDLFQTSLQPGDIEEWKKIFLASSELTGVKPGYFLDYQNQERPLADLFSEGAPDKGAINRIAEQFDLISYEILKETVELRHIYFHLGQLMNVIYNWLQVIEHPANNSSFIREEFPYFNKMYTKNKKKFNNWSQKTYINLE